MLFITFEGIDGSGKTSVANLIKDKFIQKGYDVLFTREPGGEPIAEQIRNIILDKKNTMMSPWTEALLYIAARKQHIDNVIIPALKKKQIVICDRFSDSTTVYQGYARQLSISDVDEVQNIALGFVKPNLSIFFDISPEEVEQRVKQRKENDRLDVEGIEFHNKVYKGYQLLISNSGGRFKIIDARKNLNEVASQVEFLIQAEIDERISGENDS